MRRIVSCLIVGGLLAGGPGIGISNDRSSTGSEQTESAPGAPSRYQRTVERAPRAESRTYSEIFGQPGGDQAPPQPDWATDDSATGETGTGNETQRRGTFTLSRPAQRSAGATGRGVVHAEYERDNAEAAAGEIEQVAASEVAPARPARSSVGNRLAQPVPTGLNARGPSFNTRTPAPPRQHPQPAQTPIVGSTPPAAAAPAPVGPQTPSVSIEWRRTGEISIGREFDCELVVHNQGTVDVQDIELTAFIPRHVRLVNADPQPSTTEGYLGWAIDDLAAGELRIFAVTLLPQEAGEIATHAHVRFTGSASERFEVAQPKLEVKLEGPTEVLIGEAATQIISVSNPGNGVAENVQIEALIPPGLEHVRGARLLMDIGPLHPGEVRSIRLPLAAVAGGEQTVQVQTRGDLGLADIAAADISVISPQLATSISGPGLRYLGRRATYTLSVTNDGAVATDNVQVMHKVPDGFHLQNSTSDVKFDDNLQLVSWYVGALNRGQTAQIELTFDCSEIGDFTHFVRATSQHGVISDSSVRTRVEGVSSLAMEVQDLEDPVEVGTETVYEILVTNEGSATANDISVSCELPAGISLVNVTGPVDYVAEQDLIVFRPIPTLAPNATATFKVHVASAEAGNLRFRARLSSASIEEPLIKEELTRFYGE